VTTYAGAIRAALASGLASGGFQDGYPGLLITVRHGSSIPGHRLWAGLWRRSSSAVFCQLKDVSSDGPTAAIRCFATAGALVRLWNNLPAHLRQTDIKQFKRLLNTF